MSSFYSDELTRMNVFRQVLRDYGIILNASMVGSTKCTTDGHLLSTNGKFVQVIVEGKNEIGSGVAEPLLTLAERETASYRLVVVPLSTNVAETSLTIPNIRYVNDCGRAKERYPVLSSQLDLQGFRRPASWSRGSYGSRTLLQTLLFRSLRASFSQPEILRTPIEGVVLQMKSMNVDAVVNFPFPTPDRRVLKKAETYTSRIASGSVYVNDRGASDTCREGNELVPAFSALLSNASVGDPFLREEGLDADSESDGDDEGLGHIKNTSVRAKEARRTRRRTFFESQQARPPSVHGSLGNFNSDIFRFLSVVGVYEYAGGGHQFCKAHFVRPKECDGRLQAMEEIHKLRAQLSSIAEANFQNAKVGFNKNIRPPNDTQLKAIRQLLAAAFIDQVARKTPVGGQFSTAKGVPYAAVGVPGDVFIHPTSVLADHPPPDYLFFSEIVQTSRTWIKGLTVIIPAWLSSLGKESMCTFSKPARNNAGVMMSIPRFGPDQWELPAVKV
ncbi:hypothetical protein EV702DRAFT_1049446 [Suillus placidus]|uniref:DEAD-box helicase OB fold domain-containing protein n=1 Tax=Suillus placidus TaxID=48579 RepID=A0A9P6ZKJ7_9AGAM|nr:hypothetical protein EV702DRAFT_1049446 [Suillus placidus]